MLQTLAFLFSLAFPMQAQEVDYFPLQAGNQWVYRATRFRPEPWVVTVGGTRNIGGADYFEVAGFPGGTLLLRKDESGSLVFYDTTQKQERVWAALGAPVGETFRTGIDNCTPSGTVRTRDGALHSPLGDFQTGLVVGYTPSCADAGLTSETFLPWIGLAERRQSNIAGEQVFQLIYARLGGFTVFSEKENSFALTLDASHYKAGDTLTVRMTLRNTGDQPLPLTFPSGQDYDIVIRNEEGDIVYRWSDGRAFTQIFRQASIQGERNFVALIGADLPPGSYTATANLAVSGTRIEATAGFTVQ